MAAGTLILAFAGRTVPVWVLLGAYALIGSGVGLVNAPITDAAVAGLPASRAGVAGAITSAFRQVGNALGVALLGTLAFTGFAAALPAGARLGGGRAQEVLRGAGGGGRAAGRRRAFVHGLHHAYLVAAGLSLLGAAVAARAFRPARRAAWGVRKRRVRRLKGEHHPVPGAAGGRNRKEEDAMSSRSIAAESRPRSPPRPASRWSPASRAPTASTATTTPPPRPSPRPLAPPHQARVKVVASRDPASGAYTDPNAPARAGQVTIASFTGGRLTLQLADGTVSGRVTGRTQIRCETPPRVAAATCAPAATTSQGDDESGDEQDPRPDVSPGVATTAPATPTDGGGPWRRRQAAACDQSALVAGAVVSRAKLRDLRRRGDLPRDRGRRPRELTDATVGGARMASPAGLAPRRRCAGRAAAAGII